MLMIYRAPRIRPDISLDGMAGPVANIFCFGRDGFAGCLRGSR